MDDFQLNAYQEQQLNNYLEQVFRTGSRAIAELGERFKPFSAMMIEGGIIPLDEQAMVFGFFFEENPNESVDIVSEDVFQRFFVKFQARKK